MKNQFHYLTVVAKNILHTQIIELAEVRMMKIKSLIILLLLFTLMTHNACMMAQNEKQIIKLSPPEQDGLMSLEKAISLRRSLRSFADQAINEKAISQLLWAAQGITDQERNFRAAPSAGATYPISVFVIIGKDYDLSTGTYQYLPQEHSLIKKNSNDLREKLYQNALHQRAIKEAPLIIALVANLDIIRPRYGERGERYAILEAGHIAQNISLQGVSLGLGSVVIGAFIDKGIRETLALTDNYLPLYLIPLGYPQF